jgi:hypothetical protein
MVCLGFARTLTYCSWPWEDTSIRKGPAQPCCMALDIRFVYSSHHQLRPSSALADMTLEVAFNFDPPPQANPVASEDTQAQLDEFRQMPWLEPNYEEGTVELLRVVERYWRR